MIARDPQVRDGAPAPSETSVRTGVPAAAAAPVPVGNPATTGTPVPAGPADKLTWAASLNALLLQIRAATTDTARNDFIGAAWQILNAALGRYARFHAGRLGWLAREDIEDIAATKAFDLLRRAGQGAWDVSGRAPAQTAAFLSSVARNGVLDRLAETRRQQPAAGEPRAGLTPNDAAPGPAPASPDVPVLRREFALALRRCAERLNPRVRLAWFFRVFYSMSSKEIAKHPDVGLRASHVDVLLSRARLAIQKCMRAQGYSSEDMPPGTFVELWRVFRVPSG